MTIEQKVVTVANNDTDMNNEIATQAADGYILLSITLSNLDVIMLFNKTSISA